MEKQGIKQPSPRMIQQRAPQNPLRLKLIQVAGGDAAFEEKLREMIWQEYSDADRPFGPTEDGMFLWLERQMDSQ